MSRDRERRRLALLAERTCALCGACRRRGDGDLCARCVAILRRRR